MNYNKLFLVSLAIFAIFMLGAVSATDDVSVDNITVEESSFDSVEELNDVELNENEDDLLESANQDIVSDKKSMSMNVCIWDKEFEDTVDWELTPSDFDMNDYYVRVSLSPKVNGTLSLYMDGKHIDDKKITGKTHYFNLNVEEVGKHTAEVRYSGNDEYESNSASVQFEIVSCRINVHDMSYGDKFLSVDISNAVGDIVAVVNGKRYTAPLIRGESFIELGDDLSIGTHHVHIDYLGDKNHAPRSVDANIEVYPVIYAPFDLIGLNDDREVSLQLPSNAKGNLVVKVDGSQIANVVLVNGYACVSLANYGNFNVEYDVEAYYTGTDYHVDPVSSSFIIIPQIDVETELINNQQYTLTFTLPNTYSGDLEVTAPGYDTINSKVVNGKSSVNFYTKEEGYCYIRVNYADVSGYDYSDSVYVFVGPNPNMVATVESKIGQNPVFKVNVANDAGGAISVLINGKEYTSSYFTKSGSLVIPGLADGKYTATVIYSGDYKYPSVSKTITFTKTSKSSKTKISLKLSKVTVKKSAKKLVLKATLKINGKVAKGKKITFKFNKKTYKAKTNKKGVAKITIKKSVLKKLKVGKKVKYQASYGKTTVKKTVKVKK